MKKWPIVLAIVVLLAGSGAYAGRGYLRNTLDTLRAPKLPAPTAFKVEPSPSGKTFNEQPSVIEGGVATSQNYMLVSSPPPVKKEPVDPLAATKSIPDELNLAVPFTVQAPEQDWSLPYEEACEEASILMVARYYEGQTGLIPVEQAKQTILELVAYQNKVFGDYMHTTAKQTASMAMDFFKLPDARVIPVQSPDDIKRLLANGYPVIVPAAGRLLGNPNFKAPGPVYHMFVVKGYTTDGRFITNEPGTRRGRDYTYSFDTVMNAMHDYNAEDVQKGSKVVLVLMPK